jgi:thymidylate synthase (FAD)
MTDLTLFSDVEVELVQHVGGDSSVVHAARISTAAEGTSLDFSGDAGEKDKGLINYLMREHHGTPFEHNSVTFRVKAPIMVFREWHRHRIQSYNEQSGRYTIFAPEFYVPGNDRPLVNIGTSAKPEMAPADPEIHEKFVADLVAGYEQQWKRYEDATRMGIANEMARLHLPTSIMSSMYVTANLRAWLHFLGLRTSEENAAHKGRPQREIVMAAEKIEKILTELFPVSLATFNSHGRIAP